MSAHSTSPVQSTLRRTRIDDVLDNQRQRWTQGERPFAETYLSQHPWLRDDAEATLDLIDHEVVLRVEAGEKPRLDEYVRRFPSLRDSLAIQFALHNSLLAPNLTTQECPPTIDTRRDVPRADTEDVQLSHVGSRLGEYLLLERLGQGGMGAVYLAEDTVLKRRVALKVLLPKIAADDQARARFLREAQAAATIGHENVIAVYQVGEADGTPFIAMQHLQGETLHDRLQREPRIPWPEALRIGRDVCCGLAAAHQRGLLHRDIKPSNLWLDRERGRTVILDFGLAHMMDGDQKLTSAGTVLGTPSYMSPEQVAADPLGPQTDLFSLGVVLYQALTGRVPFEGRHILATLSALANHQPQSPHELDLDIPSEFSACVMRLLAKETTQRPASAEELLTQFDTFANQGLTAAPSACAPRAANPSELVPIALRFNKSIHTVRRLVLFGLLGLLGGAAWLATLTLRVETADGILTVLTDVDDIKVVVERDGRVVRVIDPQRQRQYRLEPGKYRLRLEEPRDGLVLETSEFVLRRDGHEIVKVTYTPKPGVAVVNEESADRSAAEWVVAQGGRVHLRKLGDAELIEVQSGGTLPQAAFQLIRVEFVGKGRVTDESLSRFRDLNALEDLRLEGTSIRGHGLKLLGDVKSLRHLSLPGTPFGDDDVEHLAVVPELTTLWLGETAITDVGLEKFGRLLPNLTYLRLERTKISGTGLKHLQALKHLKNLVLSGTSLKDEDVAPLAQMPALIWLDLRATPVTDRALNDLVSLRSLRGLVADQTGITADGVRRFAQQRPECKVSFEESQSRL